MEQTTPTSKAPGIVIEQLGVVYSFEFCAADDHEAKTKVLAALWKHHRDAINLITIMMHGLQVTIDVKFDNRVTKGLIADTIRRTLK